VESSFRGVGSISILGPRVLKIMQYHIVDKKHKLFILCMFCHKICLFSKINRERSEPEKNSVGRIRNHRSAVVIGGAFKQLERVNKTFNLY